ncbi:Hypothetical protein FKW44_025369, partial [Caligus rogercresseyi]
MRGVSEESEAGVNGFRRPLKTEEEAPSIEDVEGRLCFP